MASWKIMVYHLKFHAYAIKSAIHLTIGLVYDKFFQLLWKMADKVLNNDKGAIISQWMASWNYSRVLNWKSNITMITMMVYGITMVYHLKFYAYAIISCIFNYWFSLY